MLPALISSHKRSGIMNEPSGGRQKSRCRSGGSDADRSILMQDKTPSISAYQAISYILSILTSFPLWRPLIFDSWQFIFGLISSRDGSNYSEPLSI